MRHACGRARLGWLCVAAALVSGLACNGKGENYVGRWECTSGGSSFLEIKANDGAFLVTRRNGETYPASLDDKGMLIMNGVPGVGSLPLPIDTASNELICSACGCNRYVKKADSGSAGAESAKINDGAAQKQTVADMRNTGTAMFSWLTDQIGAAAAGQTQTIDLKQYSSISRAELEKLLVPQYMQAIPEKDGWGNPYEYTLNVANPKAKQVMSIRSPGRDGTYSEGAYTVGSFDPTDFDQDIVWSDGFFVRWPQKPQQQ